MKYAPNGVVLWVQVVPFDEVAIIPLAPTATNKLLAYVIAIILLVSNDDVLKVQFIPLGLLAFSSTKQEKNTIVWKDLSLKNKNAIQMWT